MNKEGCPAQLSIYFTHVTKTNEFLYINSTLALILDIHKKQFKMKLQILSILSVISYVKCLPVTTVVTTTSNSPPVTEVATLEESPAVDQDVTISRSILS